MTSVPERDTSWGNLEDGSFSFLLLVQNWLWVNAAAEGLQKRTEVMERWQQQEVQVKESRRAEVIPQSWTQPNGEDRTEMKREAELLRCTLPNGSAWSTERKYMRRSQGKCDIFFGVEHRLRKEEEMEEQSFPSFILNACFRSGGSPAK